MSARKQLSVLVGKEREAALRKIALASARQCSASYKLHGITYYCQLWREHKGEHRDALGGWEK